MNMIQWRLNYIINHLYTSIVKYPNLFPKGVYKKIIAAGKKKTSTILNEWAHSISNHMYWCAVSSKGDGESLKAKWLSITNHIVDIHEGHSDVFCKCEHNTLEGRNWLKKGRQYYNYT